jgi:hypothetical protein
MMAESGVSRMLSVIKERVGFDPEAIREHAEQFMADMQATAEKINQNQLRIERMLTDLQTLTNRLTYQVHESVTRLEAIQATLEATANEGTTTPVYANGEHTGVLITSEKFPEEMLQDAQYRDFSDAKQGGK